MISNNFFTISDFAKLMGISRQTLIYYDHIGLFKPIKTLSNKYRLYSRSQVNVISLISMLSEMEVPLKEIKNIVNDISPDTAINILNKQLSKVEMKFQRLKILQELIHLRLEQIALGKEIAKQPQTFSLQEIQEDIPLYVSKEINCAMDNLTDDTIIDFYNQCEQLNIPLIFAGGQLKSQENMIAEKPNIISNMCFRLKDNTYANSVIPKGNYVVGYAHGDYGNTDYIYKDLFAFIKENGLKIAGNAYEEYLLDELAENNSKNFVLQILVQVSY